MNEYQLRMLLEHYLLYNSSQSRNHHSLITPHYLMLSSTFLMDIDYEHYLLYNSSQSRNNHMMIGHQLNYIYLPHKIDKYLFHLSNMYQELKKQ